MTTGQLYTVSAPSGAGKTSLLKALRQQDSYAKLSISHTTRLPRPGESDGIDYHFIDHTTFESMVAQGQFLEHAKVFDNYYGTAVESVNRLRAQQADVILEIDWQGARQIKQQLPETLAIFILPPGRDALEQRLRQRGQDSEAIIERRMAEALSESSHYHEGDYLIINDNFDTALTQLQAIFTANRLRTPSQQQRQQSLLRQLLGEQGGEEKI
ncbi:guanylate kinase [Ectothiorhodospiraceae bacterium BW-2]|nr:guanylate kinase [Ectothiorhodospiraceae bacterium BW-2]